MPSGFIQAVIREQANAKTTNVVWGAEISVGAQEHIHI
jgi:hypothetical protein